MMEDYEGLGFEVEINEFGFAVIWVTVSGQR